MCTRGLESEIMSQQTSRAQDLAKMLEIRRQIKQRTPKFQRQESWRYVRIHDPWRKPKGVDSHMRLSVKGWPALVKIGYRVPKVVRGLHPSGYRDMLVHNLAELEQLSPETDAARFAAGVGRRKRIDLAHRAKELGIKVLNGRGLLSFEKPAAATEKEQPEETKEAEPEETKQETAPPKKRQRKQKKKTPPKKKKPVKKTTTKKKKKGSD